MKLLIIEDEAKTSSYLQKGLEENGFVVDVSARGDDGLHLAKTQPYDLIILDVMLPGQDGWSVLESMRRANVRTPVIFLTARDAVQDRVKGLDIGADDYLVKPFAFSELLCACVLCCDGGRAPARNDARGRFGARPGAYRATRGGKRLDLTPKEFLLVSLLGARARCCRER